MTATPCGAVSVESVLACEIFFSYFFSPNIWLVVSAAVTGVLSGVSRYTWDLHLQSVSFSINIAYFYLYSEVFWMCAVLPKCKSLICKPGKKKKSTYPRCEFTRWEEGSWSPSVYNSWNNKMQSWSWEFTQQKERKLRLWLSFLAPTVWEWNKIQHSLEIDSLREVAHCPLEQEFTEMGVKEQYFCLTVNQNHSLR